MCVTPACKHDISKTICAIYVICGILIAHDPKMCPIVFGGDVMHSNEGAGLNVKIWKWKNVKGYTFLEKDPIALYSLK